MEGRVMLYRPHPREAQEGAETQTSIDEARYFKKGQSYTICAPSLTVLILLSERFDDAECAINLKRGNFHSLSNAAYFWSKCMSNKNGRQFLYSFVGCAVMLW